MNGNKIALEQRDAEGYRILESAPCVILSDDFGAEEGTIANGAKLLVMNGLRDLWYELSESARRLGISTTVVTK